MHGFLTVLNIHCIPLLLQAEDLCMMYMLFSKISHGLVPISNMFKTVLVSLAGCLSSLLAHSFYFFEPWCAFLIKLFVCSFIPLSHDVHFWLNSLSAACHKLENNLGQASIRLSPTSINSCFASCSGPMYFVAFISCNVM
jgi:hypothetical protein